MLQENCLLRLHGDKRMRDALTDEQPQQPQDLQAKTSIVGCRTAQRK
jgi:hypothetical protein